MTPKTATAAQLTAFADMLNDDGIYDVVVGLIAHIRDEHPRPRNAYNEAIDVDSDTLGNTLITELRRIATEMKAGRSALDVLAEMPRTLDAGYMVTEAAPRTTELAQ